MNTIRSTPAPVRTIWAQVVSDPRRVAPRSERRRTLTARDPPRRGAVAELAAPADLADEVGVAATAAVARTHPLVIRSSPSRQSSHGRRLGLPSSPTSSSSFVYTASRRLVKENSNSLLSVIASVGQASTHRSQWMQRR